MKPRVLVVEDAPVTRAYLLEVLAGTVDVDTASSCAEALALAGRHRHALWLVDAHLPDGDAVALLPCLRACSPSGTAIAHTASRDPGLHATLRGAGFVDVLVKPIGAAALLSALGSHLPGATRATPGWDDAAAAAALGGHRAGVRELRALYAAELPAVVMRVQAAFVAGDVPAVRAELHRLAASCALAGARRMGDAVRRLDAAPADPDALGDFLAAAGEPAPL